MQRQPTCENIRGQQPMRGTLLLLITASLGLPAAAANAQPQPQPPPFDQAAVDRGQQLMTQHCGFCHGSNARGAAGGPDLTRSELVMEDESGKQLGDFLKVGRPDKGMPKVDLT